MSNKLRLEKIKALAKSFHLGVMDDDIRWLIEQAERAEQLQQENEKEQKRLKNQIYETVEEKFLLEKQLQQAQAKIERYEKALREIAIEQEVGEGDFNADDVANNLIATAKEALEGGT
jgi:predicted transcriptional regulator